MTLPDANSLPPGFKEIFLAILAMQDAQVKTAQALLPVGDVLVALASPDQSLAQITTTLAQGLQSIGTELTSINATLQGINNRLFEIAEIVSSQNPATSSFLVL